MIKLDYFIAPMALFNLHINDVLSNPQSMDAIKRTLKTRQIIIENIKEQMGLIAVSSLKPEPIPVNVKVILIGSSEAYHFYTIMTGILRNISG